MSDAHIDVLIVGGPEKLPPAGSLKIQRVPFTSDGLQNAGRLIPKCNTVIVVPCYPGSDGSSRSSEQSIDENGNFSCIDSQTLRDFQVRLYTLVNGAASVYFLVPDDSGLRLFIEINITVGLSFKTNSEWSARLDGRRKWMLENSSSDLVLNFADRYGVFELRSDLMSFTEPLPDPDQLLLNLPRGRDVTLGDCVVDCAGNTRVLDLHWGNGEFVIASAACISNIFNKISEPALVTDIHFGVETVIKEIEPGWRRGKLKLVSLPSDTKPACFSFGNKKYFVARGKAWKIVSNMITHNAFEGHPIALGTRPGDAFRRECRPFFITIVTRTNDGKWYLKTK